jgi:GDPmannose 4,6-dehydratase
MKALITGITGQDGAYLAKFLLDKGYEVFGTYRRLSTPNFWRLQYLDIFERVNLIPADLVDAGSMVEAVKISEPDEIYHLAAQSFVGASFEQPIGTGEITGLGVTRVLEAIRQINPEIKFYQASTSELYGRGHSSSLSEKSLFQPASPYAAAKLYGYWLTKQYREGYNFFACNGILFNHESPLRGLEFVTRKITNAIAKIALGIEKELKLGNQKEKTKKN